MSSDEHPDLHGRPPLSIPFPLQLSEEGILPMHGREVERTPASEPMTKPKAPSPTPVRPGNPG